MQLVMSAEEIVIAALGFCKLIDAKEDYLNMKKTANP